VRVATFEPYPPDPRYFVGDDGTVLGLAGQPLQQRSTSKGYMRCKIGGETVLVHHAVLKAHVGPCPEGMEAAHGDGNPANNAVTNLRWATPAENSADRERHGRTWHPSGSTNPKSKLTEAQVAEVKRLCASGVRQRNVAEQFGIRQSAVTMIVNGKRRGSQPCE
jgi:hypothetical protein